MRPAMVIPMCEGARHIFVVGNATCRYGAEQTATLNAAETRIAGLVVKGTWSTVEVRFIPDPGPGAIAIIATCARCAHTFKPGLLISGSQWNRMQSAPSAVSSQLSAAMQMVELINGNPCACRRQLQPTQRGEGN
jgi:hypothetical protein